MLTAAELNTYVRDNFNETSAATASAAGDIVYADAANSMGSRLAISNNAQNVLVSDSTNPSWKFLGTREVNPVDKTSSTYDTWEDWGVQTIRVTTVSSGDSYQVWATLTGFISVTSTAGNVLAGRTRVGISFDDGGSYNYGNASQDEVVQDDGWQRSSIVSQHRHAGTLSTDAAIVVKAQYLEESASTAISAGSLNFRNATLAGIIVPN